MMTDMYGIDFLSPLMGLGGADAHFYPRACDPGF
jgi:hypothetical protein